MSGQRGDAEDINWEGGEAEIGRGQRIGGHVKKLKPLHQPQLVISAHCGLNVKPDSQCGTMVPW